ncbi:MAG TPA: acetylxylan esterase, partial [Bacteroidia bacterium]|nr:acetylxylan esterase [Bacteroidia bacterium]
MKKILLIIFPLVSLESYSQVNHVVIDSTKYPRLITFTAQQDHDNMMKQLGITKLRPGPSGNESAPNHANYDETIANPCPQLPDILTMNNGKKVTTADEWWKQRRPEILEGFEKEVYGRLPKN